MNTDIKASVTELMETYHERAQKIALLRYELHCLTGVSTDEMIDSMSYGHSDGIGHAKGYVSNKTLSLFIKVTIWGQGGNIYGTHQDHPRSRSPLP